MRTSDATMQSSHRRTRAFLVAHQIQTALIRDGGLREGQSCSTHGGRGRILQYARNLSLHDDEVASMNSTPASSLDGKVFAVIPPEVLKAHRRDTEAADGVEAAALRALGGIRVCHQGHRTHPRAGSGRRLNRRRPGWRRRRRRPREASQPASSLARNGAAHGPRTPPPTPPSSCRPCSCATRRPRCLGRAGSGSHAFGAADGVAEQRRLEARHAGPGPGRLLQTRHPAVPLRRSPRRQDVGPARLGVRDRGIELLGKGKGGDALAVATCATATPRAMLSPAPLSPPPKPPLTIPFLLYTTPSASPARPSPARPPPARALAPRATPSPPPRTRPAARPDPSRPAAAPPPHVIGSTVTRSMQ